MLIFGILTTFAKINAHEKNYDTTIIKYKFKSISVNLAGCIF